MSELERKFFRPEDGLTVTDGRVIEGYASVFGRVDRGGDVVEPGAYAASLKVLGHAGRRVKMLWQHDPAEPIGVWDEVREDSAGLFVKGRLLTDVVRAREAAALLGAGAIDGLAARDASGRRHLHELELWEVSLVTFPMLPEARVGAKGDDPDEAAMRDLAAAIDAARRDLTRAAETG
ncbi:MAG: HK97 family phage prohead protease [Paracoccaceae bacterium]|nr:HK97 family phage prohead protease [Paracoccaceae bacterium]